jgi:CBS domain-containing protein
MSPRAAWRLESLGFGQVYDYVAGKRDWFAAGLPREGELAEVPRAGDQARRDVPTRGPDEHVGEVAKRARAAGWDTCAVVNERQVMLGALREQALDTESLEAVEQVMDPGPVTFRPDELLDELRHYLHEHDLRRAWITTSDGRLVGLLRRDDDGRAAEGGH